MAKEYLDKSGLTYLWGKIKSQFAPLASPVLTGTPTAPTVEAGTANTQIATTEFVNNAISGVSIKSLSKAYSVTVDANSYKFITSYSTLGITADRIVGYKYTAGNYPIVLQFATEGIYLFSSIAFSNKSIGIKFLYI